MPCPPRFQLLAVICVTLVGQPGLAFASPGAQLQPKLLASTELPQPPDLGTIKGGRRSGGGTYFTMPSPPPMGRPTGRYRGGASRGEFPTVDIPLTALIPFEETRTAKGFPSTQVWGLTTAERPTFWFYLPYTSDQKVIATFSLEDEMGQSVLTQELEVPMPAQPGVIGVTLPASETGLKVGQVYRWYFKLYSDRSKSSAPIYVEGDIQRVALDAAIAGQIAAAKPQQKAELYAANGLWYDALTTLANLRLASPGNSKLEADWQQLLQSVGLTDVTAAPLVK